MHFAVLALECREYGSLISCIDTPYYSEEWCSAVRGSRIEPCCSYHPFAILRVLRCESSDVYGVERYLSKRPNFKLEKYSQILAFNTVTSFTTPHKEGTEVFGFMLFKNGNPVLFRWLSNRHRTYRSRV
jgi:hypothetical protein